MEYRKELRACEHCGSAFLATSARYCSGQCRAGAYREAHPRVSTRKSPEERFWTKINKDGPASPWVDGPCWLWTGARTKRGGYGRFGLNGGKVPAHRFAYEILVGPIPDNLEPDHLCRVTNCVNPA